MVDVDSVRSSGSRPLLPDDPHPSGNDRYRIYGITARGRWQLADTTLDGIGITLRTLYEEGQTTGDGVRVGIFDRTERIWLVNPWKGRGLNHV